MEPQQNQPSYSGQAPTPPGWGHSDAEIRAASSAANTSLICGILGLLVCAILGIFAIVQGKKAKAVLQPGDPGYGSAQAGTILGWIAIALWALGIIIGLATGVLGTLLNQSY